MSRDDYISKLFINNQDKLEQAPSADLWSKLEAELDAPVPTATPTLRPRAWGMSIAVAASVLLVISAISLLWWSGEGKDPTEMQLEEPMALNTTTSTVVQEEAEAYEELPTTTGPANNATLVIEEKEEEEARAQEKRIVEAVQKRLEEAPEQLMDAEDVEDLVMNDLILSDDIVLAESQLIEPAQNNASIPGGAQMLPKVNFYQNDQLIAPQQNYNSNSLPQITNNIDNNAEVEEVLNRSAISSRMVQEEEAPQKNNRKKEVATVEKIAKKQAARSTGRRGSIVAKAKESEKIKSPMADAHPRLYPFGFLLGRWDDDHELEGRSYEIWTLKDRNTLVGRGYKLSKDAERIFEERLRIEYRDNQIFLVMSFEENNNTVDYMLTSFDQERFVFEQKGRSKYPDKVILQQNGLQGYSVTISNSSDFLTADQQRYLEHRNRVSNVRSIRTLRHTD